MIGPSAQHRPSRAPHSEVAARGGNKAGSLRVRSTEQLKLVPQSPELRQSIRRAAEATAARLDRTQPLSRHEMEQLARGVLAELGQPSGFVGWTMVALASAFWREQVAAVPPDRRLLLLPHCLRNAERCAGEYRPLGLICRGCGACELAALREEAERTGHRVLIAEGSPAVMKIILGGQVDALLGVACLDVLEKTLDKILLSGIPCMAVPLLSNGCRNTTAELDSIRRMIHTPHRAAGVQTRSYLHLMRAAAKMFEPEELRRLIGPTPGTDGPPEADPLGATAAIALDFLAWGGKHSRPFITLAVYDALTGGRATLPRGEQHAARLPDAVKRIALAIEVFHKASLVHDDVEDDDAVRYGRPALHRRWGPAAAINVGDYLIGLGYRLVAGQCGELGAELTAEILALLADAHTRLCQGQGAELIWRDASQKRLQPLDALRIYALKTAPAFEAALLAGARLAGPIERLRPAVARFARHLGVAYQMINDLDEWEAQPSGGRPRGGDVLAGRPTVLWALAWEGLGAEERAELERLVESGAEDPAALEQIGSLYDRADVFRQVEGLIERHHQRALEAADQLDHELLRRLLRFLVGAILDRRPLAISEE